MIRSGVHFQSVAEAEEFVNPPLFWQTPKHFNPEDVDIEELDKIIRFKMMYVVMMNFEQII